MRPGDLFRSNGPYYIEVQQHERKFSNVNGIDCGALSFERSQWTP